MREGQGIYFTPAEFVLLMELAGGKNYSMIRSPRSEPDEAALTQGFATLYQRGLIRREGEGFVLSGQGRVFSQLRGARYAVLLSSRKGFAAACYPGEKELWMVELVDELLTQRYRVQGLLEEDLKQWLLDREVLDPPTLGREDTQELERLFGDLLADPRGEGTFRAERYQNGGDLVDKYELIPSAGGNLLVHSGAQGRTAELYTEEALSDMLAECFGKGAMAI